MPAGSRRMRVDPVLSDGLCKIPFDNGWSSAGQKSRTCLEVRDNLYPITKEYCSLFFFSPIAIMRENRRRLWRQNGGRQEPGVPAKERLSPFFLELYAAYGGRTEEEMAVTERDMENYVETLIASLQREFGRRLLYVGLQGSWMRGEASEGSDIDIMAVLDELSPADMDAYRRVVKSLDYADRSCGFLCGRKDLADWNRCEICHLVHTTKDCLGRLSELVPEYGKEDVVEYVRIMTGNLYHALCHSRVHGWRPGEESEETLKEGGERAEAAWEKMLKEAFKQAFFILQNKQYVESGIFAVSRAALLGLLFGMDEEVLKQAMEGRAPAAEEWAFKEREDGSGSREQAIVQEQRFALLFDWCRQTLEWAADVPSWQKTEKEWT